MNRAERRRNKKQRGGNGAPGKTALGVKMALQMAAEHQSAGRFQQAEQVYREIIAQDPKNAMAHYRLGGMALQFGHPEAALGLLQKAVKLSPDFAPAQCDLGNAQKVLGDLGAALDSFQRALDLQPDFHQMLANIASVHQELEQYDAAIASYQKALEMNPAFAEAHFNMGHIHAELGDPEAAAAAYLKTLDINPDFAEAYRSLVGVKALAQDDPLVKRMEALLTADRLDDVGRAHIEFALSRLHDKWGDVDGCFSHLQRANALRKKIIGYTIESDRRIFAHIKSLFSDLPWEAPDISQASGGEPSPVFILGMPRSGTSLVEQILASHSQVYGAGELRALKRAVAPHLKTDNLMRAALDIRKSYMQVLAHLPTDRPVITDKMPLNSLLVGFILLAMPDAKIIHMRRDSRAVCWSNFKTYFPAQALGFSCDLSDVATFYTLYEDLMAFWEEKFPGRLYELNYEALTQNQRSETEKLLAHCGLEWEDACLDFHTTKRPVKTASSGQIRKGLYQGSSDDWRRFETHLGAMLKILGKR